MSDYQCLSISVEGAIATLRLTRPDLQNRFDEALHTEFPAALCEIRCIPDLATLIITADGRSFSAGGDLEMMLKANMSEDIRDRLAAEAKAIIDGMLDLPIPIIAAVQGAAIGLGATIVACSDVVVAWKGARIADPHVVLGLAAGDGGILGWSQSIGITRAKRYLLTGQAVTGEQGFAMGLVTDLAESSEDVEPMALALANTIAGLPRGGVQGTKRAFSSLTRRLYNEAFLLSLAEEMSCLSGDEVKSAVERLLNR
ncbi:enoyl-CoA hydratase/isomerase family protein [Sphingorhabdus sp.]|jgi:enoyl-CoA hydratase|uniref:enoyl-CoA hydratase/isomerase family protein n=1 Tax=Sphingorhabdus sp. TaxID=1902408 RepID=UPI0037C6CC94